MPFRPQKLVANLAYPTLLLLAAITGCASPGMERDLLPSGEELVRDQLVIRSDFRVPSRHRLIDELVARRADVSEALGLPLSDEPINIFLFEDDRKFQNFMAQSHPDFSDRRAFFVKNDTELKIYAHWGTRVGEDLRHEVTHGYLHSVIPNMALWMDEGLAEYFEVPRGTGNVNDSHVYLLSNRYRHSEWLPDIARLEQLVNPADLTQSDYAESWLWMHYLLETNDATRKLVQDHLARLRLSGSDDSFAKQVKRLLPNAEVEVVEHLRELAREQQ